MSLTVINGRSGSGKTTRLLYQLRKSVEKNPDINKKRYVIVPDQYGYMMEKKILETFKGKYVFSIQVVGFKTLATRILERSGGIKKKILSPVGRAMLVSHAQKLVENELTLFKGMDSYSGFSDMMSQIIKEFKNYNIYFDELMERSSSMDDEELKYKIKDIALIYEKYEEELHKNFIDGEDQLKIAVDKLKDAQFLRDAEYFIDEFSDFTPVQLNMIKEMSKASDVYLTLTLDENLATHKGVFTLPLDTEKQLMRIAAENNISVNKPIFTDGKYGRFSKDKNNPELAHIEKEFYHYPNKVYEGEVKNIKLFKAQNKYEEIEHVAKDIVKKVREEGLRYNEIAILLRDLPSYKSVLKSVMNEYNLPIFIDARKEISSNPLTTLISAFFEIYSSNFSYESIFKLLKTDLIYIGEEDNDDRHIKIDKFENYCLANGIRGFKWREERWNYSVPDVIDPLLEKRELNEINEIKDFLHDSLIDSFTKLEEAQNIREMAEVFYNYLLKTQVLRNYENWIDEFLDNQESERLREYKQIEDALMEVLDQMVEALSSEKVDVKSFGDMLLVGLNSIKISLIPATLDQIIAGDISRVRTSNVKAIYIVGTNEQVLPRSPVNTGIFTDSERDKMRDNNIKLSKNARERSFFEQFYVYNALTISNKYLTVTYPISDNDGKSMRPSMVIARLMKLFKNLKEDTDPSYLERKSPDRDDISSESEALRELIGQMRRHRDGKYVSPVWQEVYAHFINSEEYENRVRSAEEGLRYENVPDELKAENMDKLYKEEMKFSVSRLENYAKCPFSYFIKYGIKAKERKEYKLDTPDVGSLMHGVIDSFSRELKTNGLDWKSLDEQYVKERVDSLMENALINENNPVLLSTSRYRYMSQKIKRVINTSVNTIKSQISMGEFIPAFTELEFSDKGDMPSVTVDMIGDKKISLIGKIDRVDVFKDTDTDTNFIRIIDYKSAAKDISLNDIYYGLQMQLLLYLDVVLKNSDKILKGKTLPGAMLYFKLDKPVIDASLDISDEQLEKEILGKLKLKGLIIDDAKVIRAMDKDMSSVSLVIPAKINNKSGLAEADSRHKSSFLTKEEFDKLREFMNDKIKNISEELLDGNISVTPYRNKKGCACDYCKFKSICQFDTSIKGNEYRELPELTTEEIWQKIKGGEG